MDCIACGSHLDDLGDPSGNQPDNGTAFVSLGHYGSTAFDPMDGSRLEINICDECLKNAAKNKLVKFGANGGRLKWWKGK